ncbi:hypothetical protein AB0945_38505 [Streptomyces sp. NPDC005474]|uniref:hypothetical protein n=1 Tax=Streptomyces sp. NPDC005474 TaxID=3154878 RepID=UPI003454A997
MQALRPLLPLGGAVLRRQLRTPEYIPALEDDVTALGRAFGAKSVENKEYRAL